MKEELLNLHKEYIEALEAFNTEAGHWGASPLEPSFEGFMSYLEKEYIDSQIDQVSQLKKE